MSALAPHWQTKNLYEITKKAALDLAWQCGCNIALVQALGYSHDLKDLADTARQAAGPGSDQVRTLIVSMLASSPKEASHVER